MLELNHPRDLVMIGAIFGVAVFVWAGWAQEAPPAPWAWRVLLAVLGVAGLALAGLSIPTVVRHWHTPTAIDPGSGSFHVYLIVIAVEVAAVALLAAWVSRAGRSDLIAPLILAIVGIHFIPLAFVFAQPVLHLAAALLVIVAIVTLLIPPAAAVSSFWCGILSAPVFLVIGIWCAIVGAATLRST